MARAGIWRAGAIIFLIGLFSVSIHLALAQGAQGNNTPPNGVITNPAGGGSGSSIVLPNPLGQSCTTLACPLTAVMNFLYTIAIPLCAIMVMVGGFQMVTSAGNPERFSKGRKIILYAAIGFAVIIVAGGVSSLIADFLG